MAGVLEKLKGCVSVSGGKVEVNDAAGVRGIMDDLI